MHIYNIAISTSDASLLEVVGLGFFLIFFIHKRMAKGSGGLYLEVSDGVEEHEYSRDGNEGAGKQGETPADLLRVRGQGVVAVVGWHVLGTQESYHTLEQQIIYIDYMDLKKERQVEFSSKHSCTAIMREGRNREE